jgi:serine/threonine protein kinase/WD40 repeat protein/tetratricopeptide (TPR) repeat protein
MNVPQDKAKSVFVTALEISSASDRQAYIDAQCGADEALRREIQELLQHHEQMGAFLDLPARALPATIDEPITERPGTQLGPYKLLEQIGEGGFGLVFMAEQQEPIRRKVALKLIKPGMDSKQVIARFQAERQALALMDHPNIAKVFDGGATPSGRPYFVMDLVKGAPITEFCDQSHLTPRQRLELFVSVCQAVQHAHQKGIIHRDLKPSNVLVAVHDTTPVVRVIDFGVAKALGQELTDKTLFTGFAQMIGTPPYMAPEQAGQSSLDVDTRSDIYSLGVLLYELLTGMTPFDKQRFKRASYDEIRRIIREEEPPRPSTRISTLGPAAATVSANRQSSPIELSRLLRGELDWIVIKALEKDRNRRYESASAFAADVQRYLHDEPVLACPPSVGYRLRKAMRRNKKLIAAGAVFVALLVAGTTISVWQAVLARAGREAADRARAAEAAEATRARAAEKRAVAADHESRRTLARQYVARGTQLVEQGNLNEALLWFAEALRKDVAGPQRQAMHRLRIATTAQLCPRPVHLLPHAGPVVKVVLSQKGNRLLTVSGGDNRVGREARVWDLTTGKPVTAPMRMPFPDIGDALFSPDGKCVLLTSAYDGTKTRVWSATTGEPLTPLLAARRGGLFTESFSPDGSRLLLLGGYVRKQAQPTPIDEATEVQVWDMTTGKQAVPPLRPKDRPWSAEFSRDGKRVLMLLGETCQLWDAETGKPVGKALCSGRHSIIPGHHGFSPDGTKLFVFDEKKGEGSLQVVDVGTGQPIGPPRKLGRGTALVGFSPAGNAVLINNPAWGVRLIDPLTGQMLAALWPGYKGNLNFPRRFSPDGQHLWLSVQEFFRGGPTGWTGGEKELRLWHARTGQVVSLKHVPTLSERHELSPDGRKVLVRRSGKGADLNLMEIVEVYDAESGNRLGSPINHQDQETNGALSSDSRRLLTWGGTEARVWDAATGQALTPVLSHGDLVLAAAFFREGPRFVTAGADGLVRVWAPQDWPAARVRPGGYVRGFRLSPDGGRLLVSSISPGKAEVSTGTQRLWDVARGQPLTPPAVNYAAVQLGAFAEEGRVLLTWDDHAVQLWDTETGRPLHPRIESAHRVGLAAVSPQGRRLAVREDRLNKDGTWLESWVRIWDGSTGKPLTKPFAKAGRDAGGYSALELSPEGERLLLFTRSQGVSHLQLWGPETAQPLTPLIPCSRHAFSKDGRHLLTTLDDRQGKLWDLKTGAFLKDLAPGRFAAVGTNGREVVARAGLEAQVCDATTKQPLAPPLQPRHGVRYAGLVAGGRFAVTLSHPTWGTQYQCQIGPSHLLPERLIVSEIRLWDPGTGEQLTPALPVTSGKILRWGKAVDEVQVTRDGRKLVFCSDLITCNVWELPQDTRPVEELVALAQALSGRRVNESGGTPSLGPEEWLGLRARYPEIRPAPFDVVRWYDHQAELAEPAGDWRTVREQLDRVIVAEPDVWMHYRRRGRADGNLNDWDAGVRDNTRAIELGADIPIVWHNRGIAHLALGHFKEAGDDLEKAAGMEGIWQLAWFNLAEARAFQGDAAGYRRACTGLLSNFGRYSLSNVVWNCCLAPSGVADGNVLIRLAEQDRSTAAEQDRPKEQNADALAGARTALGAALYRAAKYQESISVLTANKDSHGAYDWLFLAMAHHHLGQKGRAEKYLNESLDWIDHYADDSQKGPFYTRGAPWNRRQQLRLLSEEAEKLILGPSPSARLVFALRHHEKTLELRKARLGPHHPDTLNSMGSLGDTLARLGRWDQALAAIGQLAEMDPGNHWYMYVTAALHLRAGDVAAYRRACRAMLERFGDTDQPDVAERTAKTCLLAPGAVTDLDRVLRLADRAVTGTEKHRWYRWFVFGKALAEYRAGRHAQAVEWLRRFAPDPGGWNIDAAAFAVLAMAQLRLGRVEAAQAALGNAEKIVADKLPDPAAGRPFGGDWDDWLRCQILLGEARQKMKKESGKDPEGP